MVTKEYAIEIAKQNVADGYAIRYSTSDNEVWIETADGWIKHWPEDEEIVNITEGYYNLNYPHYI